MAGIGGAIIAPISVNAVIKRRCPSVFVNFKFFFNF